MTQLLTTPINAWHRSKNAKMAEFAGFDMPIQYEGILAEHEHTRTAVSIFDICHMGEFLLSGENAAKALSCAVTHNIDTLKVGKCRYGFLLNEQGTILDDLIVYRIGEDSFMLVVNGACQHGDFAALKERLPAHLNFQDVSDSMGKLDVQGPQSYAVLKDIFGDAFPKLAYFSFEEMIFDGIKILVSRTGYTGELGFELYLPSDKALMLWEKILQDSRVKPAGLGARDTLRLEAGLPLYGHELDTNHNPTEAGMGKMLTTTADYVGRKGADIINQVLLGLQLEGRRSARHGDNLCLTSGEVVGKVTSGSFAPSLGYAVAFAWVDAKYADIKEFTTQTGKANLLAKVTSLPFYTTGSVRNTI